MFNKKNSPYNKTVIKLKFKDAVQKWSLLMIRVIQISYIIIIYKRRYI